MQPEDSLQSRTQGPQVGPMKDSDIIYTPSFLKGTIKMADVDIDPFGEHELRTDDNTETGKNIPFTPVGGRR